MSIKFACPGCGKGYNVDDSFGGRTAKCKGCGARMTVPAADSGSEFVDVSELQEVPYEAPSARAGDSGAQSGYPGDDAFAYASAAPDHNDAQGGFDLNEGVDTAQLAAASRYGQARSSAKQRKSFAASAAAGGSIALIVVVVLIRGGLRYASRQMREEARQQEERERNDAIIRQQREMDQALFLEAERRMQGLNTNHEELMLDAQRRVEERRRRDMLPQRDPRAFDDASRR